MPTMKYSQPGQPSGLEKSRAEFAGRVDSEYLGFETYAGISEVLPPLDKLTGAVARARAMRERSAPSAPSR